MKSKTTSFKSAPGARKKQKTWKEQVEEKKFPYFDPFKPHAINRPPAEYNNIKSQEQSLSEYLNRDGIW